MALSSTLIIIITLINVNVESQVLSNWTLNEATKPLPEPKSSLVIGYNSDENAIWLLGGFSANAPGGYDNVLWDFNIATKIWTQHSSLSFTIHCGSQTYTSINNIIYFQNQNGNIGTFNMDTQIAEYPSSIIPSLLHSTTSGCMTTDGRYIFVIGGSDWNNRLQIFDTSIYTTNQWVSGPNIPHGRYRSSCHTSYNNDLYVIGGTYPNDNTFLNTIIKIDIHDITNINSFSWIEISEALPTPSGYHRSVEFGDIIYIIGGTTNGPTYLNNVILLNTSNDQIFGVQSMINVRSSAASVVADSRVLVFGGYDESGSDDVTATWEYTNSMPTLQPTPAPTNIPTKSPTNITPSPTNNPIPSPTNHPTPLPTNNATPSPTSNPTSNTVAPTTDTESPTSVTVVPTATTSSPTTITPAPTSATSIPTATTDTPTTITPAPSSETSIPTATTATPTTVTPSPASETSIPTATTATPITVTPSPTSTTSVPTATTATPTTVTPSPTSTTSIPTVTTATPTTDTQSPALNTIAPTNNPIEGPNTAISPTAITEAPTSDTVAPTNTPTFSTTNKPSLSLYAKPDNIPTESPTAPSKQSETTTKMTTKPATGGNSKDDTSTKSDDPEFQQKLNIILILILIICCMSITLVIVKRRYSKKTANKAVNKAQIAATNTTNNNRTNNNTSSNNTMNAPQLNLEQIYSDSVVETDTVPRLQNVGSLSEHLRSFGKNLGSLSDEKMMEHAPHIQLADMTISDINIYHNDNDNDYDNKNDDISPTNDKSIDEMYEMKRISSNMYDRQTPRFPKWGSSAVLKKEKTDITVYKMEGIQIDNNNPTTDPNIVTKGRDNNNNNNNNKHIISNVPDYVDDDDDAMSEQDVNDNNNNIMTSIKKVASFSNDSDDMDQIHGAYIQNNNYNNNNNNEYINYMNNDRFRSIDSNYSNYRGDEQKTNLSDTHSQYMNKMYDHNINEYGHQIYGYMAKPNSIQNDIGGDV